MVLDKLRHSICLGRLRQIVIHFRALHIIDIDLSEEEIELWSVLVK